MIMLIAGMGLVQPGQVSIHLPPHTPLLGGVLHGRNGSTAKTNKHPAEPEHHHLLFVVESNVSKFLPPCPVNLVSEARMI